MQTYTLHNSDSVVLGSQTIHAQIQEMSRTNPIASMDMSRTSLRNFWTLSSSILIIFSFWFSSCSRLWRSIDSIQNVTLLLLYKNITFLFVVICDRGCSQWGNSATRQISFTFPGWFRDISWTFAGYFLEMSRNFPGTVRDISRSISGEAEGKGVEEEKNMEREKRGRARERGEERAERKHRRYKREDRETDNNYQN